MSCCACCCFYPKYKRRVDNIYPRNLDLPLVKAEVDKLQYYAKIHPEKLSKIGEYLYQNLKWGLSGTYKNRNYVKNTVEAVDKILLVITPQDLNYYAGNYLKIVKKLLEQAGANSASGGVGMSTSTSGITNNANNKNNAGGGAAAASTNSDYLEYQKMAACLFQKFCEKEASNLSTTSYNLNYDTFVCQFSSMCYNNNKDERIRAEVRSSALQCLATMVKRLVPDDSLRAGYLWDNMDKIVPALLFIMHENFLNNRDDESDESIENNLRKYIGDLASKRNSNFTDDQVYIQSDVTVQFRKRNSNNENKSSGSSDATTPDEVNAMIKVDRPNEIASNTNSEGLVDPDHEAKMLLRNLATKADYTTISKVVMPILAYLDDNKPCGWEYSSFVNCIFRILMHNVKQQHAIVIKELIKHLDSHRNSSAQLKCHIIKAISICIKISSEHSIGTTGQIIEIFTNFLKHLNFSVEKAANCKLQLISKKNSTSSQQSSAAIISQNRPTESISTNLTVELNEQQNLQREIISAMGQYTSNLPDYAKNDVIMFIARQINSQQISYFDLAPNNSNINKQQLSAKDQLNAQLRAKYFECLVEICTKYKPTQLFSAFTGSQFLDDILKLTLVNDWTSRRKAHEILHHLLDKYQLMAKIRALKPNLFLDSMYSHSNNAGIVVIRNDFVSKSTSAQQIYKKADSKSNLSLNKANAGIQPSELKIKPTDQNQNKSTSSLSNAKLATHNHTYLSQLNLNEKSLNASKEDKQFMRKYGRTFLAFLNENLFLANNRRENFECIYLTTCLLIVGLFNEDDFLLDLIRFGFHIQELALLNYEQSSFTFMTQCNVHKFLCAYFLLVSKSSGLEALQRYCLDICALRKKKEMFKYLYPEYILLDETPSESNTISASTSLTEAETEFKRELSSSAKDYFQFVSNKDKNENETGEAEQENENGGEKTPKEKKSDTEDKSKLKCKISPWLFDKQTVCDILETAGFKNASLSLFKQSNDFSFSVLHLHQTQMKFQSILKYRCPYSNSYDSLSALASNDPNAILSNSLVNRGIGGSTSIYNMNDPLATGSSHKRGQSGAGGSNGIGGTGGMGISPSLNQFVSTPRRSIDVDSNLDDDTSYDSTSQISIDPSNYDLDFINQPSVKALLQNQAELNGNESNQQTLNSLNLLKQQYYIQQQQYQDLTSFETIKRVLFNGNTPSVMGGSNMSNSGFGSGYNGASGEEATLIGSSSGLNTGLGLFMNLLPSENSEANGDLQQNKQQLENNSKIINYFKQKPFDELKQTLQRSNQSYMSTEKYQKMFEIISKESISNTGQMMSSHSTHHMSSLANKDNHLASNASQTGATISASNILGNYANTSASSLSNHSSSVSSSGILYKENYQQQKMVPLNDIEFPKLFMY